MLPRYVINSRRNIIGDHDIAMMIATLNIISGKRWTYVVFKSDGNECCFLSILFLFLVSWFHSINIHALLQYNYISLLMERTAVKE